MVDSDRPVGRQQILVVQDVETLRLLADPLRLRLLELLREQPRTVKELAAMLRVPATRLYYHVQRLEAKGLVTVAETRLVSGIVERRYRVTAYRLTVDKDLLGASEDGEDALDLYLSVVLDEVRREIQRSVEAGLIDLDRTREDRILPRRLVLGRKWLRLTPEQIEHFAERYNALTEEFSAMDIHRDTEVATSGADARFYELLIGFYPTVPPDGERDERRGD